MLRLLLLDKAAVLFTFTRCSLVKKHAAGSCRGFVVKFQQSVNDKTASHMSSQVNVNEI